MQSSDGGWPPPLSLWWPQDHLCLFMDDVVLLTSSVGDIHLALGRFAAECETVGMTNSTSKSEAMVCSPGQGEAAAVEEFKHVRVLFMRVEWSDGLVQLQQCK